VTGRWFSPGTPVSSTNKTDCHDITEILLIVALNTINLLSQPNMESVVTNLCKKILEFCHYKCSLKGWYLRRIYKPLDVYGVIVFVIFARAAYIFLWYVFFPSSMLTALRMLYVYCSCIMLTAGRIQCVYYSFPRLTA
jgi:hypothetical protein